MSAVKIVVIVAGAALGGSLAWFVGKNKKACATGGG